MESDKSEYKTDSEKSQQENVDRRYNAIILKWGNFPASHRTILKLLPVFLILAAIPITVWFLQFKQNLVQQASEPPTRYVNSSTGIDAGNGDINNPWKTFKYALEHASANDTIVLREGVYAGTGWVGGSNAAAAGITIQNYPGETASVQSNSTNLLQLENWKNVTIKSVTPGGLRFEGKWPAGQSGNKYGIFIYYAQGQPGHIPTNVLIDGVIVNGIAGYGISFGSTASNNTNIGVGVSSSTIQNVEVYDTGTGIRMNHVGIGNLIQNNNIHDNTRLIANTQTPTNDDNGAVGIALDNIQAADASKTNPAVTVKNNTFKKNSGVSYDYGYDGGGVELYQSSYTIIENNVFDSNEGGIETGTSTVNTMPVNGNVIRYNIFYGRGNQNNKSPLLLLRAMKDGEIYNNTIDLDSGNDVFRVQESTGGYFGVLDSLKIKNNIIKVKSANKVYALNKLSFSAPGVEINNNLIYSTLGESAIVADNSISQYIQTNLSGWQAATSYSDNDIWYKEPQFVDEASHNYSLKSTSPALGLGAFPSSNIPTVTTSPAPSLTPNPTLRPTSTPTPSPKPTFTPTPTLKPTYTPTPTPKPTATPTPSPVPPTAIPTLLPTSTPTPTIAPTPTKTVTNQTVTKKKTCYKIWRWQWCF